MSYYIISVVLLLINFFLIKVKVVFIELLKVPDKFIKTYKHLPAERWSSLGLTLGFTASGDQQDAAEL